MERFLRQLVLLVIPAFAVIAQEARPVPLPGPGERLSSGFTSVSAISELVDRRVVIIDATERTVSIGDFVTRQVHPVSRRGSGPTEYLQPRRAFSTPNGETLISDPANARFLRLSADGQATGAWRAVTGRGQPNSMANLSATWDARGIDDGGRLYFELLPPPLKPGESVAVPIVRSDLALVRSDTVARYTLLAEMQSLVPTPGAGGTAIIRPRAWPSRPEWIVATNGTIAIASTNPYRVSFIRNGQRHDGPVVDVQLLRVTDADRTAFSEAVRRVPRGPSSPGTESPRPAGAAPPTHKRAGAPIFPEVLPPFTGRDAVQVAPDGRVWISRAGHANDSVQVIDVFGTTGRIDERIALPPHRRLLAISDSFIYLAWRDSDDLEFVERYARRGR